MLANAEEPPNLNRDNFLVSWNGFLFWNYQLRRDLNWPTRRQSSWQSFRLSKQHWTTTYITIWNLAFMKLLICLRCNLLLEEYTTEASGPSLTGVTSCQSKWSEILVSHSWCHTQCKLMFFFWCSPNIHLKPWVIVFDSQTALGSGKAIWMTKLDARQLGWYTKVEQSMRAVTAVIFSPY